MKRISIKNISLVLAGTFIFSAVLTSCSKNKSTPDVPLPPIGGYASSDSVASANLVAYWNFDGNQNEIKSGTAATSSARATYMTNGVKGQALMLDSGYVFYNSIPALNGLTTFSVSAWVQVRNNQDTTGNDFTSMIFQLSKPNSTFGNINLGLETSWKPATNDSLVVHGWYTDPKNGLQDNRNDPFGTPSVGPVLDTAGHWINVMMTVDNSNPVNFNMYANGVNIGAYSSRGTSIYTPMTPSSVIIGGWLNNVPGQPHTSDTWPHAFVGGIDQVRVYNKALSPDEISALYQLEKAGR
ncbi:MAG: LamG-like jellyroll fold domain-containing protein [Ginsengibacter sp.]